MESGNKIEKKKESKQQQGDCTGKAKDLVETITI